MVSRPPPRTPPTATLSPDSSRSAPSSPPSPPPHSQSTQSFRAPRRYSRRPAQDSENQWRTALHLRLQTRPYSSHSPEPGTTLGRPFLPALLVPSMKAEDFLSHNAHDGANGDRTS